MHRLAVALALIVLSAGVASGHGGRVDFALWGPFAPAVVSCQRHIARAAATCARSSWDLTRACRAGRGAGTPCDSAALTQKIQEVRIAALDAVDDVCSERQAQDLGFLGLFDLRADLIDSCRAWSTAVSSAVFGIFVAPGQETQACTSALAESASRLAAAVFRDRRRCMDTIAAKTVGAAQREALLARTSERTGEYSAGLATGMATRCGGGEFQAIYGRSAAEVLTTLGQRADCLAAALYIQDRVLCAASICGNGVIEPGEFCDDGNNNGGDTCSPDCAGP